MGSPATPPAPVANGLTLAQQVCDRLVANRKALGLDDLTVVPLLHFLQAAENALPPGVAAPAPNKNLLNPADYELILDQAEILLGDLYPHLPYKKLDFAKDDPRVDPSGDIASLRAVVKSPNRILSELDFHIQVLKLFASVRDPHTVYILPQYFHGAVAFLPFRAGFYVDASGKNRFLVTSVMDGFDHPDFKPGAELVSALPDFPDFTPAVQAAADLTPGANRAAQMLRGLLRLTVRPLALAGTRQWRQPYDDLNEAFHYRPVGSTETKSILLPWNVAIAAGLNQDFSGKAFSMNVDLCASFAFGNIYGWSGSPQSNSGNPLPPADTPFPSVFAFQTTGGISKQPGIDPANLVSAKAPAKQFGYIAIKAFDFTGPETPENAVEALLGDFQRILNLIQPHAPDGLILDLRGNPGGHIEAAEGVLQMLLPRPIKPANFHLANSPHIRTALSMLAAANATDSPLQPWFGDIASHSTDFLTSPQPLTDPGALTRRQSYQGPIVLLVDAVTYSAADIFTGGFKDNAAGIVIGADPTTGGGGASNVQFHDLISILPSGVVNLKPLPPGAGMSLALKRSSRVLQNDGLPIEDKGVTPDQFYPRTANELLFSGGSPVHSDMIFAACDTLAGMPVYRVDTIRVPGTAQMSVTLTNLDSVDFLLDSNPSPVSPSPAASLAQPINIPLNSAGGFPEKIIVRGYSAGAVAASATLVLTPPDDGARA